MNECLFIGGYNDGEKIKVPTSQTEVQRFNGKFEREIYYRMEFVSPDGNAYYMFRHNSLGKEEAFEMLIKNYNPE